MKLKVGSKLLQRLFFDMSVFKSDEIGALLRSKIDSETETMGSCAIKNACDVSFALFLEPTEVSADASWAEYLVEKAIETFSPSPIISHCEIVVPPIPDSSGGRVHFATYFGSAGADWQNQRTNRHNREDYTLHADDGVGFYLLDNGARWRAIPVFGPNATENIRSVAESNIHAPYSLAMYPTSAKPFRALAGIWSDTPKHKAHCAVLTARVLKEAGVGKQLPHVSAWYSPSSLYNDMCKGLSVPIDAATRQSLTSLTPETAKNTIRTLLHAPLSYNTVRSLGDSACIDAIRSLTLKVCDTAAAPATPENANMMRGAQKDLARALLRWVILRKDGDCQDIASSFGNISIGTNANS